MPGNNIKRALRQSRAMKAAAPFDHQLMRCFQILKGGKGVLKSRGLARQLAPIGPLSGRVNLAP